MRKNNSLNIWILNNLNFWGSHLIRYGVVMSVFDWIIPIKKQKAIAFFISAPASLNWGNLSLLVHLLSNLIQSEPSSRRPSSFNSQSVFTLVQLYIENNYFCFKIVSTTFPIKAVSLGNKELCKMICHTQYIFVWIFFISRPTGNVFIWDFSLHEIVNMSCCNITAIQNILIQMAEVSHGTNHSQRQTHQIQLQSCSLALYRLTKDLLPNWIGFIVCLQNCSWVS